MLNIRNNFLSKAWLFKLVCYVPSMTYISCPSMRFDFSSQKVVVAYLSCYSAFT